jgi:Zn-dependent peptidase ImmA (M78 family)
MKMIKLITMSNPVNEAKKLLEFLGWNSPSDMTIEEICWASGIIVKFEKMDGSEARIVMDDKEAIITVSNSIQYQPKINYILSHEIGHAVLHRDIQPVYDDTHKTLSEWYATGVHEAEANIFAAELLMPSLLFTNRVKHKKLSLHLIEETAAYFTASKTATFLRYRDLGDFPVMLIFIENGVIKWKSHSNDFPFTWLQYGTKVPAFTVAGDYFYKGVEEQQPVKVEAIEWFGEDYNLLNGNGPQKLWEQCFPTTQNSILTCLWTL